jgi:hypothetical protein
LRIDKAFEDQKGEAVKNPLSTSFNDTKTGGKFLPLISAYTFAEIFKNPRKRILGLLTGRVVSL